MKHFLVVTIALALYWNAIELSAQDKNAVSLKDLILSKYDGNRDGALEGLEKGEAVLFLKKMDKDGNGEVSAEEQVEAIKVLQSMSDPKFAPVKVIKKEAAGGAKSEKLGGAFLEYAKNLEEGRNFTTKEGKKTHAIFFKIDTYKGTRIAHRGKRVANFTDMTKKQAYYIPLDELSEEDKEWVNKADRVRRIIQKK